MILRIEDTDRTRFVENAQENLIKMLNWAGIECDESPEKGGDFGPYIQSERYDLYTKYAQELLDKGQAYYAFDSAEELDAMRQRLQSSGNGDYRYDRPNMRNSESLGMEKAKELIAAGEAHVIRMKTPEDEEIVFHDLIRGEVKVHSKEVDDQVLIKSDGFPTYHLANVVDDHLMQISHVIRGEEWLPSTPKHCILYRAFGWEQPTFAHLPLLLNQDKTKLSKRTGSVAVEDFKEKYIRDAFLNFVALLGWNPCADREIYEMSELIELFNLEKVNKAGAVFDVQKLDWYNFQYLQKADLNDLAKQLNSELAKLNLAQIEETKAEKICSVIRERVNFVAEIPNFAPYFFGDIQEFDQAYQEKHWKAEKAPIFEKLVSVFENSDDFTHQPLHDAVKQFCEAEGIKMKEIMNPLRLMLTGKSGGAGMFDTVEILGKETTVARMRFFIQNNK
jgi:glutamyl-tRNA synthetase